MVLGFIVFWPLGLAMLAYIIWGDRIPEIRRHFEGDEGAIRATSRLRPRLRGIAAARLRASGNVAFDDYREQELKRLDEERRRLDEERASSKFLRTTSAAPATRRSSTASCANGRNRPRNGGSTDTGPSLERTDT